jgi:hypothetical protein
MGARAEPVRRSPEREWWLRALAAPFAPRAVFAALRDDSDEAAAARHEPVLALAYLGGIAIVLASPASGQLSGDGVVVAAWTLLAGAIYGAGVLFAGGLLLHLAARRLGSRGSYRRARHVLAFALAPLVLSLALWPVRLAVYGGDLFRAGGSDHGTGTLALHLVDLGFALWAVGLLVAGVRAVHGWSVGRSAAAVALAVLLLPVLVVVAWLL